MQGGRPAGQCPLAGRRERGGVRKWSAVKRATVLQVPDGPADVSAEAALRREIAKLAEWLEDQGLDLRGERDRAHGSRDQLYWRFGYLMGMKQALALLTRCDATVH